MTLGQKIRSRRQELGLTMEELGEKVGVQKSAINKYEKDMIKKPSGNVLVGFSKALDLPITYFLNEEQELAEEYKKYQNTKIPETISKDDAMILDSIHERFCLNMLMKSAEKLLDEDIMRLIEIANRFESLYK